LCHICGCFLWSCVQVHSFVLRICTESGLYTYKSCASGYVAAINVKSKGENVADNFGCPIGKRSDSCFMANNRCRGQKMMCAQSQHSGCCHLFQ
jgi:hypothetical protein